MPNKRKDICRTIEECEELYRNLDPSLKEQAAKSLRTILDEAKIVDKIKLLISQYGHLEWLWHLNDEEVAKLSEDEKERGFAAMYNPHFGFGMGVRNWLRRKGYGEKELQVHNLDDIYINLIEDAVKI